MPIRQGTERRTETNMKKIQKLLIFTLLFLWCESLLTSASTTLDKAPYPNIEYGYSATVEPGTIRYITQLTGSCYFNSSYWGYWQRQANIECGTSCISMALSYLGINKTPKDILDPYGGLTCFTGWGADYLTPSFATAMNNYLNGNGKYSPPILHLYNFSARGHFVLVIGKVSDTVYQILDPANNSIWNMTIAGNVAYYSGKRDVLTDVRQYYLASGALKISINSSKKELTAGIKVTHKATGSVYQIQEDEKTVKFVRYKGSQQSFSIPAKININGTTYKVTAIGNKAFYKNTALKEVTIPYTVKSIGKRAFYGCKKLKTITLKTSRLTDSRVGIEAFKGVYKKVTVKTPKALVKKYKKLLKTKGISAKAKFTKVK